MLGGTCGAYPRDRPGDLHPLNLNGAMRLARLTSAPRRVAPAPSRVTAAPKVAEKFYLSKEWRALRAGRMLDADYFAAKARAKGERLILDHVRERKDGGDPLDPANTQWLTFSEHQAKTERAKRARGGLK